MIKIMQKSNEKCPFKLGMKSVPSWLRENASSREISFALRVKVKVKVRCSSKGRVVKKKRSFCEGAE